ncbi:MAG: hypothetical protein F9K38_10040 [Pseudorhodoplanes sp.]|nr:MAG: hypothetical protein F9K38_10040 [Pseudorhodoplanes sp.]
MPWVRIPADQLANLPLFGIDLIKDDGDFAWYRGARGRMHVEKKDPNIFVEDINDAIQLKAKAILCSPGGEPIT